MKIFLNDNKEAINYIKNRFIEFNKNFLGSYETKNLIIYAIIDENIVGGIICKLIRDYIFLEIAYVEEQHRNKNIGSLLFTKLEQYALANNYKSIQAETLSIHNYNFYKKLGFDQVGFIKDWNQGIDSYFMKKIYKN